MYNICAHCKCVCNTNLSCRTSALHAENPRLSLKHLELVMPVLMVGVGGLLLSPTPKGRNYPIPEKGRMSEINIMCLCDTEVT